MAESNVVAIEHPTDLSACFALRPSPFLTIVHMFGHRAEPFPRITFRRLSTSFVVRLLPLTRRVRGKGSFVEALSRVRHTQLVRKYSQVILHELEGQT